MASERRAAVTPRLIVGLTVIAVGIAFWLDQMGRVEAQEILRFWPLAMVGLGLASFFQSTDGRGQLFGVVVVGLGLWFLGDTLGWVGSSPFILLRYFWPGLLLLVGASMVWRSLSGPRVAAGISPRDRLSALALLSGVNVTNTSQSFAGGQATAVMGGCEIDLRQAKIAGDEAVVEVFALWGGIEIKVPDAWSVVGQVTPILGGFDAKAVAPSSPSAPRLVVSGSAIMGGVEVHN